MPKNNVAQGGLSNSASGAGFIHRMPEAHPYN
jgi:hypothetical protein